MRNAITQADSSGPMKAQSNPLGSSRTEPSAFSRHIIMVWLVGMFILLPVDVLDLPLNLALVDVWTIMALPVIWLSVRRGKHVISLYYTFPMWLILVGSFASTIAAPAAKNGIIVILKEIFGYIWFLTVTIALVRLNAMDFRRVLVVWSAAVLLHGLVIVAQFLSPAIWQFSAEHLGRGEGYGIYRPSGLFTNANSAAFFQLLGFVPLVLMRPSGKVGVILGLVLLGTMLSTGSMGSMLSFTMGSLVALAILTAKGHILVIVRLLARLAIAAVPIGAVLFLVISQNPRYQNHLQRILLGRAERSSESRFVLWERGVDVFIERKVFLWGIGPENFRVVDGADKQLHNDFMAFSVERGVISTLGLGLFASLAINRALRLFLLSDSHHSDGSHIVVVVLLSAMIAAFVYSLTHQIFHNRQLWMILALQEAMHFRLINSGAGLGSLTAMLKAHLGRRSRSLLESSTTGT